MTRVNGCPVLPSASYAQEPHYSMTISAKHRYTFAAFNKWWVKNSWVKRRNKWNKGLIALAFTLENNFYPKPINVDEKSPCRFLKWQKTCVKRYFFSLFLPNLNKIILHLSYLETVKHPRYNNESIITYKE